MRRNLLSLKPTRKPYSELSFPEWVSVTPCKTVSRTYLEWSRHGAARVVVRWGRSDGLLVSEKEVR